MKITKISFISSIMAVVLVAFPFASSAFFESNQNIKADIKTGVELRAENQADKGYSDEKSSQKNNDRSDNQKRDTDNSNSNNRNDRDSRPGFFGNIFGAKTGLSSEAKASISVRPNISGITAPTVLKVGETGTWKVAASDPSNGSLSYSVNWGDNGFSPLRMMAEPVYIQNAEFTHAYATAGNYMIAFTVKNSAGATATSRVSVHVGDTTANAPVISNVAATKIKQHQATITWSTDVRASTFVWFSKTSPVNTTVSANRVGFFRGTNHSLTLNRLDPGTTYYVIVGSVNKNGKTMSSEISFTTLVKSENSTPVITSVNGQNQIAVGAIETVTIRAYDPNNGSLSYRADWGDSASLNSSSRMAQLPFVQSAELSHVYTIAGTYTATFTVSNNAGKETSSSMKIIVTSDMTTQASTEQ